MTNVGRKIVKGSSYIFIFSIFAAILGYALRFLLAKNLSVKDFGLFYSVMAFVTFFFMFKDLGLGSSLTKFISEYNAKKLFHKVKSTYIQVVSIQLSSVIILSIIIFFLRNFLAVNYFQDVQAKSLIVILLGWYFFSTFQDSIFFMFFGLQNFFMFSLRDFMKNATSLIFVLIFILIGFDYLSPAISYLFATILTILIIFPILLNKFNFSKYKFSVKSSDIKNLFSFGFPMLLSSIGGIIIIRMDTIILTLFRSLEEVGVYNIVLPTATLFLIFGSSFGSVLFPISSELWAKKKINQLGMYVSLMYKYILILTLPFALTLFSFSKLFLRFFFGQDYVIGFLAMQILLLGVIVYTLGLVNNSVLMGIGKPKEIAKIVLIAASSNLILNLLLIPFFGIEGAALATAFSYMLIFVLGTIKVLKVIKIRSPVFMWLKTFFAGIIFVFSIYFLKRIIVLNPWLELILISLICFIVYIFLLFFLKLTSLKELKLLIRQILIK